MDRVTVVLGADCGDLALRGAVGPHVPAAHRSVDGHETAVGPGRFRPRRRRDAFAHPDQGGVVFLGARDVPAGLEQRHRAGLVGDVHLLGADRQRHVGGARLQALQREVKAAAARGAGVLDVEHRYALDPDLAEDHLARHRDLALQRAVGHARVVGGADVGGNAAGVLERALQRFAGQVVQAALEVATEDRHRDAGDVEPGHGPRSFARWRASTRHASPSSRPCRPRCAAGRR